MSFLESQKVYEIKAQASSNQTARKIEYEAFRHCTQKLSEAREDFSHMNSQHVEAIHKNLDLWNIIATDVASPSNLLPTDLKAKLFYLFEFTNHLSKKALLGATDISALIDINISVMRGLRGEGESGDGISS